MSCYAYGSAVIPQIGNEGKMTDLIIVYRDLKSFHQKYIAMNGNHYSKISKLGSLDFLVKINQSGSGVYYNPSIYIDSFQEKLLVKYGVVSINDFTYHLNNWIIFF